MLKSEIRGTAVPASSAAAETVAPSPPVSKRDPRVDVLRGLALMMIFIDHIPDNSLGLLTLHNFGFSDAAEVFVLLAGFSSMLAYGRVFEREGARTGLRRIFLRLSRLYLFQVGLLLITLVVVLIWTTYFNQQPTIVAPILNRPLAGIAHALALHAVPSYLDILPLYILLLTGFPLIYFGLHKAPWLTLAISGSIWLAANLNQKLNLPNWINGESWFFDPFAWQFLFAIGAALAMLSSAHGGEVPRFKWLTWLCALYLVFAFFEAAPWEAWHLPNLQPIGVPEPDKSHLGPLRLLNMLAFTYLILSSKQLRAISRLPALRPLEACGRHSLEVFSAGCVLALLGRLTFRTAGSGLGIQVAVNIIGILTMCLLGLYLERLKHPHPHQAPVSQTA